MSQKEEPIAESKWVKRHPKATSVLTWFFIALISVLLSLAFFLFAIPFGLFIVLSTDAVKSLIEGEATILGFFGLIAVYLLTSYDNRMDKLEEKILDSQIDVNLENLRSLKEKIKIRKRRATNAILAALISLILSFFLSIVTLGILDVNPTNPTQTALQLALALTTIASTLLFIGVFSTFLMIYRIGREPE
jgi:hypothetical protein